LQTVASNSARCKPARLVGVGLLLVFNLYAVSRPYLHKPSAVMEWRKGPLIHESSPYSTTNAAKIFWPLMALLADAYIGGIYGWTLMRRRMRAKPAPMAETAFAMALLLGLGVAGEFLARAYIHKYMYTQYHPDPELLWFNRPNLRQHRDVTDPLPKSTNSLGFRMLEEIPPQKGPDEFRIFVMGDSSTFGLGVEDEETFCYVLQQSLREATGKHVLVINSGAPGLTSYQGLILLQRYGLPLQSDLVIWAFNNDPCLDMARDKGRVSGSPTVLAAERVLFRSDVFLLFRRVVLDAVYGWDLQRYQKKYPSEQSGWVRRIPFDDYQAYLRRFVELTRAAGVPILFVRMPLNRPLCEKAPIFYTSFDDGYRDYLTQFCHENDLPYVDFEHPWLENYSKDNFLTGHLFHPSPTGHRFLGMGLANYILSSKYGLLRTRGG
jgi:lysophospholipase L1-like esterase